MSDFLGNDTSYCEFISGVLSHERIGLLHVEDQLYELYLGDLLLGEVDTHWMTFTSVR